MNICCFSRVNYWHGIHGGMDLHGMLLSEGIAKRGHQVTIISTRHPKGVEFEKRNGVQIYYLKDTVFGSRRKGWATESVSRFHELHQKQPFDIVWSQSFDAFGLTRLRKDDLRVPIILILHGCIQQELKSFISNISNIKNAPQKIIKALAGLFLTYFIVQRPVISFSDKIIAVSNEVADSFSKWYGHTFLNKNIVIMNGVDTSHYYPDKMHRSIIRNKYDIKRNDILLLAIGRITKEKGFHIAIEALARVLKNNDTKFKLVIVGTGDYYKQLKRRVHKSQLQDEVLFAGFVENKDTVMYYTSADIVLNPSLTAEGSSFILLEAMACAKPVIASKVGGINSILMDNKNGLTFEPGNSDQLSDKIKLVARDRNLANRLSESGRDTVLKNFSVDKMLDRTLQVMKETTDQTLA